MDTQTTVNNTVESLWSKINEITEATFWINTAQEILPFVYGIILIFVAHFISKGARALVKKWLHMTNIEKHLNTMSKWSIKMDLVKPLSMLTYYIVFLFFLPSILDFFWLTALMQPIQTMINDIVWYIPNIISAIIIWIIFYIIASIGKDLTMSISKGVWINNIPSKIWIQSNNLDSSHILWQIVFWIVGITWITQVAQSLDLQILQEVTENILVLAWNIFLGTTIIIVWLILARTARKILIWSWAKKLVAHIIYWVITLFIWTVWLEQMNIWTEIISTALIIILWAIWLGTAIAIWIWAKDSMWELVKEFIKSLRS